MKKLDLKILENADLKTAGRIAEMCPSVDETERKGLLRRLKKRCGNADNRQLSVIPDSSDNEEYYEYKLTGAGNMKRKWLKPVRATVTALVIVGGLAGGFAVVKSMKKDKPEPASSVAESTLPTDTNGKQVVTIGLLCYNPDIESLITKYNKSQEKYTLKLVKYTDITDNNNAKKNDVNYDYSQEKQKLKLDIISGDAPDIIYGDNSFMNGLIYLDMFEDMYGLMDNYNGIKRGEILSNMLDGFDVNGKLPLIGTDYRIFTAIAKTKFVGNDAENWTVDRFIETAKSIPDNMQILKSTSFYWQGSVCDNCQSMSYYAAQKLLNDCIDRENNTCNFDNAALKKAIEFALDYPDNERHNVSSMSVEDQDSFFLDMQYAMINDKALVSGLTITGLGAAEGTETWGWFGEDDMTFVGYPSENGSGAVTEFQNLYGINKSSDNKEGAWDFLSYVLKNSPVSKAVLDEQYNTRITNASDNIYSQFISWDKEKGTMTNAGKLITQKRVDQLYNYIQSVKVEPFVYDDVKSIIKEEFAYIYNGERTPDQCIDILNDRVEKYLAENE